MRPMSRRRIWSPTSSSHSTTCPRPSTCSTCRRSTTAIPAAAIQARLPIRATSYVDHVVLDRLGNRLGGRCALQLFPRGIEVESHRPLGDAEDDARFPGGLAFGGPLQAIELPRGQKNLPFGVMT